MSYVDTNVILAKYFPGDRVQPQASLFLETRPRKTISPITVIELAAVISRLDVELKASKELLDEKPKRRIRALVEFMIRDSDLVVASVSVQTKVKLGKTVTTIPIEYHSSLGLAHALKLKTLDLLPISYADLLKRSGYELENFVTYDQDVLSKSKEIKEETGIEVKEPSQTQL